jgi:hypothetical protein
MQSTEVAFAHPHEDAEDVFAAALTPTETLQFRPTTGEFAYKSGRKKVVTGTWRLNENPVGKAPSAWIDIEGGDSFALWYDHPRNFYSIKLSEPKRATGTLML